MNSINPKYQADYEKMLVILKADPDYEIDGAYPLETAIALYNYGFSKEQVAWFFTRLIFLDREEQQQIYRERLKRLFLEIDYRESQSLATLTEVRLFLKRVIEIKKATEQEKLLYQYLVARENNEDVSEFPVGLINDLLLRHLFTTRGVLIETGLKLLSKYPDLFEPKIKFINNIACAKFPIIEGDYLMEDF